jgi:hypothetical protein
MESLAIVRTIRRAATGYPIAAILLCVAGTLAASGAAAHGETIPYVSSKCSGSPDGMIYVAAGHHVFHQPPQNLRYIHGISPELATGLPVSPRPFEPNGCPNHPMRGAGFEFSTFSDVDNPGMADFAIGGSVQIIDIDPSSWWDTFELFSLRANACGSGTEIAPGLIACRPTATNSADQRKRSPFVVLVDPRHYAGPLGQSLAVHCQANLLNQVGDDVCEISYRLGQDVSIWYHFQTSLLPLSGLIAFDRELRRRLSEAEIADYWWPVFPASRPAVQH